MPPRAVTGMAHDRQHHCFPVTYVGVEDDRLDDYEAGWLEGMKKGRISVSFGPLLLFELVDGISGIRYGLGGQADRRLIAPEADVLVSLDFDRRRQVYAGDRTLMDLKLVGNAGTIWESKINPEQQSGQFTAANHDRDQPACAGCAVSFTAR